MAREPDVHTLPNFEAYRIRLREREDTGVELAWVDRLERWCQAARDEIETLTGDAALAQNAVIEADEAKQRLVGLQTLIEDVERGVRDFPELLKAAL